jgi:predicted phosphodiesterase
MDFLTNSKSTFGDKHFKGGCVANVLAIGDTHEPFCRKGYLDFCNDLRKKYKCTEVVHMGDLVDNHALGQWDSDPDGYSAGDEFKLAKKRLKRWAKVFPKLKVCIGNHDLRPYKKAFQYGLNRSWLKGYNEAYETPKTWQWELSYQINNVKYQHGTKYSGPTAHARIAAKNRQSTVIGHIHAHAGIQHMACHKDIIWGMNVGWGGDETAYSMAYGKDFLDRPVVSAGVILENGRLPILIPMKL